MEIKMESSEHEFQQLQQKRIKEIMDARAKILAETTAKARKFQLYYVLVELALTLAGYLVVGFMVSWWLVIRSDGRNIVICRRRLPVRCGLRRRVRLTCGTRRRILRRCRR